MIKTTVQIEGTITTYLTHDGWDDAFCEHLESYNEYFAGITKALNSDRPLKLKIFGCVATNLTSEEWNHAFFKYLDECQETFEGLVEEI